jgi:predicted membrane-bound spermidine synthase
MPLSPSLRLRFLATLLWFPGACALVYQMAWMRELRLVFGGATPATAAVLAIFMSGLGVGSAIFGRRAETVPNPLRLYALIELGVGLSALLTPLLLYAVEAEKWLLRRGRLYGEPAGPY